MEVEECHHYMIEFPIPVTMRAAAGYSRQPIVCSADCH